MLGLKKWIKEKNLKAQIDYHLKKMNSPITTKNTIYMARTYGDMSSILESINELLDKKTETKEEAIEKIALIENIRYTMSLVAATLVPEQIIDEKPPFAITDEVEEKVKKLYESVDLEVKRNVQRPNYVG